MLPRNSHTLQPLTRLMYAKVKFKWKDVKQKSFGEVNRIVVCNNLLYYPDFNIKFDVHIDASDLQLGEVIN